MTSYPFDCAADVLNWRNGWSPGKTAWCCLHRQLGCNERLLPARFLHKPWSNGSAIQAKFDVKHRFRRQLFELFWHGGLGVCGVIAGAFAFCWACLPMSMPVRHG